MKRDLAAILAVLQADFLDELPERLGRLESAVLAYERQELDAFDELFRQVHSLKGAGGSFGVSVISTICHQFETFLSQTESGFGAAQSAQALAYVDLLRRTLPASGREPQSVAAIEQALEAMRTEQMGARVAILVVEGSQAMRRLYGELLGQRAGIHLAVAETGLGALERLLHEPYDLVVASREMPDLNGVALTAAMRESGRINKDVPVVLVTSNPKPVPSHLGIRAKLKRDPRLTQQLMGLVEEIRARRSSA